MRSLTSFVLREKYTELEAFYIKYNKKNLRDACSLRTRPRRALWCAIKTWAMQKRIEMSTATFLMALKHDKWQISLEVKGRKGSASCNRQFIFNQLLLSVGQYGWTVIVASVQHKMIQYLRGLGTPIFKLCIQRMSWLPISLIATCLGRGHGSRGAESFFYTVFSEDILVLLYVSQFVLNELSCRNL